MISHMKTLLLQIGRDRMLTKRVPMRQKRRIWRITVREGIILWNLDKYTRMVVILWYGNLGGVTFQRFGLREITCIFSFAGLFSNRFRKNRHVALKVVRSATQYKETALDEIKLLEKISSANPSHPGRQHIVSLLDHFEHSGPNGEHVCLVFEALGESVLSTIKRYQYRGLPIHIVKQITKQVLLGLDYLHRECGVIHTDLKPENVLISIDNAEEVIAESTSSEQVEEDTSRVWRSPQPPRYPSQMEHRVRPRRFVTRSQPLPSPASVVPKSFSNELNRVYGRDASISPTRNSWQGHNDPHNVTRSKPSRENTADILERDLSDMSLDYQLRKSQLAASRKRFSQDLNTIKVKIIDVGNACWVSEHFTNDLQTRQYRSPEVILGAPWGASADVWSMSCMVTLLSANTDCVGIRTSHRGVFVRSERIAYISQGRRSCCTNDRALGRLSKPFYQIRHVF